MCDVCSVAEAPRSWIILVLMSSGTAKAGPVRMPSVCAKIALEPGEG